MNDLRFYTNYTLNRIAVLILLCIIFPAPAAAQTPQPPTPSTGQPALGFHLGQGDAEHVAAARAAGGQFAVVVFNWANIEPEPNYLYWEKPDAALRAAEFYGLNLIARLDQPPAWALDDSSPTPFSLDAYADFSRRVAERYGSRLAGLILWNEPNLSLEWNDQPPNAAAYVEMLKAAYPAVKSVAPDLPVAMAGLASTEGEGDWAINDLDYLQALYAAGAGDYFDVLTAHPYGFGRPPNDAPEKFRPNFRRLELYRDIMAANDDGDKPLWVTEMGWLTWTDDPKSDWQVVSPETQADYILGAIDYAQANYPWLTRLGIWQLNAQGDEYGFGIWHGAEQGSPAYKKLVERCPTRSQLCDPTDYSRAAPPELPIAILAPDAPIRLGDRGTLHPHWVHLYQGGRNFSPAWRGEFFLSDEQAGQPFDLLIETMQITQPTNRIFVNGTELAALHTRARPDITSTWVTQQFSVPSDLLQPGPNSLTIAVGPRNPARQYNTARWENMQFRYIRLTRPVSWPPALFDDWQPQPSPGGWSETSRLRPDPDGQLWLTGNRPGQLWRVAPTSPFTLTNYSGTRPDLVFNDLLPASTLIAATTRGLFVNQQQQHGSADALDWQPAEAPAAPAYSVIRANGRLWAGFEGEGLWQSATPAGPWQRTSLTSATIIDLISRPYYLPNQPAPIEQIYAVAPDAIFVNDGLTADWQPVPLPGLSTAALEENGEFYGDKLRPRLTIAAGGRLVLRHQDRLWLLLAGSRQQVAGSEWQVASSKQQVAGSKEQLLSQQSPAPNPQPLTPTWQLFGPEHLHGKLFSVADCCGAETVVGTNKAGLWQLAESGEWQRLDDGLFDLTDVTTLLRQDETLFAAGDIGLFAAPPGEPWQAVPGLSPIVSDLLADPADPLRWLAATPTGIFRSRDAGHSWQAVSPPWTVWKLAFGAQGRLFAGRSNGLVWTDDFREKAVNWQTAEGMGSVFFLNVRPHPVEPALVWSGTWGNNIAASSDGGESVAPLHNGLETLTGLDLLWHPTPGQVTLATIEGLYRTDDGGQSWFKLPGPLQQQTVYSLLQTDDGTIWAGAADGLWLSRDYGAAWQRVETLPPAAVLRLGRLEVPPPIPVWQPPFVIPARSDNPALVYRPQQWLWAGTERAGLWLSQDNGQSWQWAGLPVRAVYGLVLDPVTPRRLVVATDGGLFAATTEQP